MNLEIGDVFLVRDFSATGINPHYQIVIHKTFLNDLVLVYTTTQTEKTKKRCHRDEKFSGFGESPVTYVEMPAGSCSALPQLCAINCNKAFLKSENDCINGFDFKKMDGKLDLAFIDKVKEGIRDSIVVSNYIIEALKQ